MHDLSRCVDTLNVLGDESRLRLCTLLRERELRVTDLVRVTGISQSGVSTHLGRLREAGLVRDRRDGSQAFYALAVDSLPGSARAVLDEAAGCADPTLEGDRKRLRALEAERRGVLPESFTGEMDRRYSPGRTWPSLAVGLAALLELGDVLDAGSGDGSVAAFLAPRCRSLTCVDISPRMVEAANERLARYRGCRAVVADAHELPYRAASFDAVVAFHTLTYAEHPARVVQECARVLRPGGHLVLMSLDQHKHTDVTVPYGERHPGFSPRAVRAMIVRAGLDVTSCGVACREAKRPHFQVVLAVAGKSRLAARQASRSRPAAC